MTPNQAMAEAIAAEVGYRPAAKSKAWSGWISAAGDIIDQGGTPAEVPRVADAMRREWGGNADVTPFSMAKWWSRFVRLEGKVDGRLATVQAGLAWLRGDEEGAGNGQAGNRPGAGPATGGVPAETAG